MIIVAGTLTFEPETRDAAVAAAVPLMEEGRAQQGCIAYVFAADPVDPARVSVYEHWADAASLQAHLEGPAYKGMLATLTSRGIRGFDVKKYEVGRSGPVYGKGGKPTAEFD